MKIVIIDPHKIWFKTPIDCLYNQIKPVGKYDWLIDNNFKAAEVLLFASYLLDCKLSSYEKLKEFVEVKVWSYYNCISNKRFINKKKFKELESEDIILIFGFGSFNYSNKNKKLMNLDKIKEINGSKAKKYIHLTHYAYGTDNLKTALINLHNYEIVAEADIRENEYFKSKLKCLSEIKYRDLPFIPNKRFRMINHWDSRENIAVATGSAAYINDDCYVEHFKHNQLQSGRFELLKNADLLKNYVDCKISIINTKEYDGHKSKTIKKFQFIWNVLTKKTTIQNERKYYKNDIVEMLNKYKIIICPEENIGLPGIGFIEAIKCGCVLLTASPKIYSIYGMVPGFHFIVYDGSIDGLINVIEFYQKNDEKLRLIGENAQKLINKFDCDSVFEKFVSV